MCGRTVEELLGDDVPGDEVDAGGTAPGVDRRPLVVPVRLGDLAAVPTRPATPSEPTASLPTGDQT